MGKEKIVIGLCSVINKGILSWQRLIGIFRGPFCMHGEIGIPTRFYRILDKCAACFRYIPTTFYTKISALFQGWRDILRRSILQAVKLALLTRLSMDLLLLVLKIFFKVISRKGISYRSSKINLQAVRTFNISSYGRRAFSVAAPLLWNSLPQHIRDAGSLDILCAFLNWWFDCGVFICYIILSLVFAVFYRGF